MSIPPSIGDRPIHEARLSIVDYHVSLEARRHAGHVTCRPSLAYCPLTVRFGVFIEPSKQDEITLKFSKYSKPLLNDVTGSEGLEDDFLVKM